MSRHYADGAPRFFLPLAKGEVRRGSRRLHSRRRSSQALASFTPTKSPPSEGETFHRRLPMIELTAQHATDDGAGGRQQRITAAQLVAQHATQDAAEDDRQGRVSTAIVPAAVVHTAVAVVGTIDHRRRSMVFTVVVVMLVVHRARRRGRIIIVGSRDGGAGTGAAIGGAAGGMGGGIHGGMRSEQVFQAAYRMCMRGRGHNVLNYS